MDLEASEAIQFQYDLITALTGLLVRSAAIEQSELTQTLQAIAANASGRRKEYFEMVLENFQSDSPYPSPPELRIVK